MENSDKKILVGVGEEPTGLSGRLSEDLRLKNDAWTMQMNQTRDC